MKEIKQKVDQVFNEIENCHDLKDLIKIKFDFVGKKYLFKESKYPSINFKITAEDAKKLRTVNLLDEVEKNEHSALEKLMLAMLWKNGDLGKEKHIIEGILESTNLNEKSSGHVFYQFGKHLNNPENQPIIDKHILRAYLFHKASTEDLEKTRRKYQISKNDEEDIKCYINWANSQASRIKKDRAKTLYHIDKILFAIGKYIRM